ncbi:hypothetical protein BDV59DRAFT_207305 [Aspergillus ambiguus]|uniref:D-alanine--D-alanine ligase family protein n=1 Tax=Aspergillus ambiguus TaxID=176160 RepID=UPI003CCE162E
MAKSWVSCLNIALISERRSEYLQRGYSEEDCAALTHEGEVEAVMATLSKLGHRVTLVDGIEPLVKKLAAGGDECDWDLAFNMAQGFHGSSRESQVPALLEAYNIPYTFSSAATISLCQNKGDTKIMLDYHRIPSAPFVVIPANKPTMSFSSLPGPLKSYPLFVKLTTEGSSKGIDQISKVKNLAELEDAVRNLKVKFSGQDILIEPFLAGREFTVSILGTGQCSRVVGVREHVWTGPSGSNDNGEVNTIPENFATRESKCANEKLLQVHDYELRSITDSQISAASLVALRAWRVFNCRDAGRVDIRFDSNEPRSVPNVLEINPIAGLLPGHSPLPESAQRSGISFEELLNSIIESVLQRTNRRIHVD